MDKKEVNNLIFDINKITDFIFGGSRAKNSDIEITETSVYDEEQGKYVPNLKEVKEVKSNDSVTHNSVRYDMMRMFIDILVGVENMDNPSIGEVLTLNTMHAYGLITDVNSIEND